ncbi:MAG: AAA family ATPase [Treponema sp.]|uniref:AAA family ATPase n=1 Tax=Treponema sp. TaxID=166 RepID=UPI00298E490E|nr:AAA family ATPase [Treponema sp.]MCQ2601278.1 AAA family ATPase [Treponema sp.]
MSKVDFDFITNADKIMNTDYPPTPFIVKDLIPGKGLVIFAGPSKAGKSLFITQMLNAVTSNSTSFIGFEVSLKGPVLYLALEDTEPRLKDRFVKQNLVPNENFRIGFKWSLDEKAICDLDDYLTENPEIILVVIDTKAKICKEQGTQISYQSEYNFMGMIKSVADKHEICILLVTHLRKRPSQEDVFNEINGTSAIMGAADTIMILKRPRNQNRGILSLTSRDFQERDEEIYLNYETLTWHSQGESTAAIPNMTPERQQILSALNELGGSASPKQIGEKIGKDNKVVGNLLAAMEPYGFVKKSTEKRGVWIIPSYSNNEDIDSDESEVDFDIE